MSGNPNWAIRFQIFVLASLTAIMTNFSPNPLPAATAASPVVTAYVWDYQDAWTKQTGAAKLLADAGFEVKPLVKDQSPWGLSGVIFIGSFASDDPAYAKYMERFSEDLYKFVDDGNLLVQMTQADQTENRPPFLPTTLEARRCDRDFSELHVLSPDNVLIQGFPVEQRKLAWSSERLGWECFDRQGGFEVVLCSDANATYPILMEGAYGQGRIVLAAMHLDKFLDAKGNQAAAPERMALAQTFAKNLFQHAQDIEARKAKAIAVTPSPRAQRSFEKGSWTLALLPDTQVYAVRYPGVFSAQTAWLRANAQQRNIKYALHLGDVTDNNTETEWQRAAESMKLLEGYVPYVILGGNHDYGPSGDASTRETFLNQYFSFDETSAREGFGGAFEPGKLDNTYHLFEAGGQKWIVVALEWAPRDEVVTWANEVMAKHADRKGILITHAFMFSNSRRYDHTDKTSPNHWNPHHYRTPGTKNDGQQLWDKLVRKHNFVFTFNGHVLNDGTGYRADHNDAGKLVHQMLANYQMRELGGEGYLRLLEFTPDGNTVHVLTYSPLYDRYLLDQDQTFTIRLDEAPADQPAQRDTPLTEGVKPPKSDILKLSGQSLKASQ